MVQDVLKLMMTTLDYNMVMSEMGLISGKYLYLSITPERILSLNNDLANLYYKISELYPEFKSKVKKLKAMVGEDIRMSNSTKNQDISIICVDYNDKRCFVEFCKNKS